MHTSAGPVLCCWLHPYQLWCSLSTETLPFSLDIVIHYWHLFNRRQVLMCDIYLQSLRGIQPFLSQLQLFGTLHFHSRVTANRQFLKSFPFRYRSHSELKVYIQSVYWLRERLCIYSTCKYKAIYNVGSDFNWFLSAGSLDTMNSW